MPPAKVANQEEGKVIPDYILENCAKYPDKIFITQPMGDGIVKTWTFGEFLSESKKIAAHIESLNLPVPSQIAIMSKNCAYWLIADLAIMMTGHVGVPVYPTLTADTTRYTLGHSEAKLLFVGKLDEHPWDEMKKGIPEDLSCISFPLCPGDLQCSKWDELVENGAEIESTHIKKRSPEEMATIIYTSGTTGVPKGVMLSFKAITEPTFGLIEELNVTSSDRYLSYLPVSHGMERWVGECVVFVSGLHVFFAESLSTFKEDLVRCQPTLFLSVPRLWSKFQQGVFHKMSPKKLDLLLKVPLVKFLVRKKILKALGLNHCRYAGSGSAPLPPELLAWYRNLGLELLEGYGMTENFNYSHITKPGGGKVGYVGEPHPGVEQRISVDGEVEVRSPGMMIGYFKAEEKTKKTLTEDGWLRTGDKGELDGSGHLKITGRIKDLFKTSKGKYCAPSPIENEFISNPKIEQACVGGHGRPAAHVIVLLGEDAKKAAASGARDALAKELMELLSTINEGLNQHERVQFISVANEEWLPENGFVTPTNKIKRAKIEEEHVHFLDEWYASKEKVIWHNW